ncbi:MAG: HAMP domain-containing histidine kinase [Nitrospirae bacterium]|nr:HAMP domain-containing histidine kinase [Candidatus Manganitrophaceae bacterium]
MTTTQNFTYKSHQTVSTLGATIKTDVRLIVLSVLLELVIFIIDINIPLGFAGGVPYVSLVLLSLFSPRIGMAYIMAAAGSFLTVVGYVLSSSGGLAYIVLLNRGLALTMIWITAILVHRYRSAIEAAKIAEEALRKKEMKNAFSKLNAQNRQVVQIEKLSSLGLMIGEIAHQINNPLVGVVNMAQLALREKNISADTKELLEDIQNAGEDCRDFLHQMMEFTKISCFDRKLTEIQSVIEEAIDLCKHSAKMPLSIKAELPKAPVYLEVDPILIRHALFNLISNAMQADENGAITVRLRSHLREGDEKSGWALLVEDKGPGISEEHIEKIFVPFFTTRTKGTGLGLPLVQHVAILHGGEVSVKNLPEGGAQFTFWLPG